MLTLALVLAAPAHAGERTFAFSYSYGTVPKGAVEVEHYLTMEEAPGGASRAWEHQVELEYGITDRLEGGLYLVGEQGDGGALAFTGYKGRLRYRLGAQGVWPVDVGLYAEYAGTPDLDEHVAEAKVIVSKDIGKFVGALNLEYVLELEHGEVAHELEPILGAGYRVTPAFTLGAEGKVEVEFEGDEVEGPLAWAGPSVHLAGEGGRLWWTVAVLAPIGEESAEHGGLVARSLLALNL